MSVFKEKKLKKDSKKGSMFINDQHSSKDSPKKGGKRDLHTLLFIIVSIAILVIFLALVFFNSGILNKYTEAVDANGHRVSTSELSFYYKYQYNNFVNQYQDYLSYVGLDTSKDLNDQECSFSEGQTWAEYFMSSAVSSLSDVYLLCDEANAAGYTLSDKEKQDMESSITSLEGAAKSSGYTTNSYLRALYGKGVNLKLFSDILYDQYLSTSYYNSKMADYTNAVTEDDINNYYNENTDKYLNVSYRSFMVTSGIDTDNDDEATQAQKLADAKAKAEQIAASIKTEDDFIKQAYDNASDDEKDAYAEDSKTLTSNTVDYLTNSVSGDDYAWLIDPSRQVGDIGCIQVDNDFRILMYLGQGRDTAPGAADIIMIKVNVENEDKDAAKAKIDEAVSQFEANPTKDNFLSLVSSYSDEQDNADGVYTDIKSGSLGVSDIDTWLYADDRAIGDTQVIETDTADYYVYVTGLEESWHSSIKTAIAQTSYDDWHTSVSGDFTITEKGFGKKLVMQ